MTRIGYARVSTDDQNLDLQIDALRLAGCERIFREKKSGASRQRPRLNAALAALRPGDTLVVWKLDRLGRSFRHLVDVIETLEDEGKLFVSTSDGIDTSTPTGKLVCRIISAISDFERSLIVERTRAGMAAAKKRGKALGRRRAISPEQISQARLLQQAHLSLPCIARQLAVNRTTLWRTLEKD
jgi:DNA invertase Pin-like site-specific DNA recombinase